MAKSRRRKRHSASANDNARPTVPPTSLLGIAALCTFIWIGYAGFQDRTYEAFIDAGNGAFGRHNYDYAARMYTQALQEAERLDPRGREVSQTLRALSLTYKAMGREDLAADYLERAGKIHAARWR